MDRICEHCGSDTYFAREFPRVRDESAFWHKQAEQKAFQVAKLELERDFAQHRDRTDDGGCKQRL